MSTSFSENQMSVGGTGVVASTGEAAAYGGLIDVAGGIATVVLAIIALSGIEQAALIPIAVIVFGAALLIEGGAMVSEFAQAFVPAGAAAQFAGGGLSALFLVGASGIVLGVLALLGIATSALVSVSVIAFGAALLLSSTAVRQLYEVRTTPVPPLAASAPGGGGLIAGQMASGSAGVQLLGGLTAIVLGILAVAGTNPAVLVTAALIVLGATLVMTGSTLSALVMGFMRPSARALP